MPRLVRHDAMGPVKIDPAHWPRDAAGNLKPVWVCACGLSKTFPICDGAHKTIGREDQDCPRTHDPRSLTTDDGPRA